MAAISVLHPDPAWTPAVPDDLDRTTLSDLGLGPLLARLAPQHDGGDLTAWFATRLTDPTAVRARQAVFADLDADPALVTAVRELRHGLERARRSLARATRQASAAQAAAWHLQAGRATVAAVTSFAAALDASSVRSAALLSLRDHLRELTGSPAWQGFTRDTAEVAAELAAVRYRLHLAGSAIEVTSDDDGDDDYTAHVTRTFAAFRRPPPHSDARSAPRDPAAGREPRATPSLEHLETLVLERVAELEPDTFAGLARYRATHPAPIDHVLARFDAEVAFYLAYLDLTAPLRHAGLAFTTPELAAPHTGVRVRGAYDLMLADQLLTRGKQVVANDLDLDPGERLLIVSGANQGGKTTFARTVGQLHHLAALGCPVPAAEARLALPDRIVTHFARGERLEDRRGRLLDDLVRIRDVLAVTTDRTLVITNELFRSTTVADATALAERVVDELLARSATGVLVTFIDDLADRDPAAVSLVATVDDDGSARRTFRVERRPADGRAYARALAERHGLTHEQLTERLVGRGQAPR